MTMKPRRIESITELALLSRNKDFDCFIRLFGGLISRKTVRFNSCTNVFRVHHHIDDTISHFSVSGLLHNSNIGLALEKKALYYEK